jgi:hypothetical protein
MKANTYTLILFSAFLFLSCMNSFNCLIISEQTESTFLEVNNKMKSKMNAGKEPSLAQIKQDLINPASPFSNGINSAVPTTDSRIAPNASLDPAFQYFYKLNINCSNLNCGLPNGLCVDKSTCKCLDNYAMYSTVNSGSATVASNFQSDQFCNYIMKKQLVAFLLELFFPYGIGHLYCGRLASGIIKLFIALIPLITCLGVVMTGSRTDGKVGCASIMGSLCGCILFIWAIVDWVMFGINNYKDGNGMPLAPW